MRRALSSSKEIVLYILS